MPDSSLRRAIAHVYGEDHPALTAELERYERALCAFRTNYGAGSVRIIHAPGRLNLIGEHTDYNHGYVMPIALDKDILIVGRPRRDALVNLFNLEEEFAPRQFRLSRTIPPAAVGDWANYAQGAGQWLQQHSAAPLVGCDLLVEGSAPLGIPRGAGLSSSSALTVAVMCALVEFNRMPFEGDALATGCAEAEWYVGTRGGVMDHFSSLLGQRGKALFLDCRPADDGRYLYEYVPLPDGYTLMIVESGVEHRNTGPYFNRRVAECRIGVRLLQRRHPGITHLRDVDGIPWSELEPLLPECISSAELEANGFDPQGVLDDGLSPQMETFRVRQRCRHVISENKRVRDCAAALRRGDMEEVGRLLHAAHASASQDYEISTPEIDALVALAEAQPGCLGARLTGAGWGGCVVALVRAADARAFAHNLPSRYMQRTGLAGRIFACRSAAGAGLVWEGCV